MRLKAALCLLALGLVLAPAAGAMTPPGASLPAAELAPAPAVLHVAPAVGRRHTTFVVTFRPLAGVAVVPAFPARYTVIGGGPRRSRCVSTLGDPAVPEPGTDGLIRVRIAPPRRSHGWCTGTYHGIVYLIVLPICDPIHGVACPMFVGAPTTIGRFSFRVT